MADTNPIQGQVLVNQLSPMAFGEGKYVDWKGTKRGEGCIIDFYTEMILEGRGYQVRAGTATTPIVGDVVITDAASELCVDAGQGLAVFPVYLNIAVRLGTGTLHEYALKSVDTASTAGTVFVPLPLLGDTDAVAAVATARAQTAGAVVVTAELATTTRRLWAAANELAVAAGHEKTTHEYEPRMPHIIANNACCYCQIAGTTTGPSYYAHLDWIELLWASIR